MALTDIVFQAANSAVASRGNSGLVADVVFDNLLGLVSPIYEGGYWSVSATFKTSANTNLANGTIINAFHSITHNKVGSGVLADGSVVINVVTQSPVYLVADPSGLSGETVCTTAITPS